jgi:hypothetical protein
LTVVLMGTGSGPSDIGSKSVREHENAIDGLALLKCG